MTTGRHRRRDALHDHHHLRIAADARTVIWVGTDDGNVQVTRNGGVDLDQRPAERPGRARRAPGAAGSRPRISTTAPATSTFDGHRSDDFKPYVFKTTDYGKTWTNIAGTASPTASPVYVIREDPKNKNLLFLGTEFGVFFSLNGGQELDEPQPQPAHGGRSTTCSSIRATTT